MSFRHIQPHFLAAWRAPAAEAVPPRRESDRLDEVVVELFDRFRDPLLRYLWHFGLTLPDGEEVIQEVFLALYRHLKSGKSDANLPGWVFRVAHNLALKHRSRTRREITADARSWANELAVDPGPSPEDDVLARSYRARVLAVVQALPEVDRRCLSLRAEGLRYREIAEVLNISLGGVSMSVARSLRRIARAGER
jgi:RNA polymerase sigma-70 factor (ECF subfamily)